MHYVQLNLEAEKTDARWFVSALSQIARTMLPSANPDFEQEYDRVQYWWLELDENGNPMREIGFDAQRLPIVAAPLGKNFGCFTDSSAPSIGFTPITQSEFELQWRQFTARWEAERGTRRAGQT